MLASGDNPATPTALASGSNLASPTALASGATVTKKSKMQKSELVVGVEVRVAKAPPSSPHYIPTTKNAVTMENVAFWLLERLWEFAPSVKIPFLLSLSIFL